MDETENSGETEMLMRRALHEDQQAWRELVNRNSALVWGTARAYSATPADAEDVFQVTWLLLAENVTRLRDPGALPGWLVTTARREAIRTAKARQRESPVGVDSAVLATADPADGPENVALRSMLASRMWQAFTQLSHRCQQLLRIVAVAPDTSYTQVSAALGIARGTVGPKKIRCLAALRRQMASVDVIEEAAG